MSTRFSFLATEDTICHRRDISHEPFQNASDVNAKFDSMSDSEKLTF